MQNKQPAPPEEHWDEIPKGRRDGVPEEHWDDIPKGRRDGVFA